MNTKGALRKILATLHPNTILKPNPDPNARPNLCLVLILPVPLALILTLTLTLWILDRAVLRHKADDGHHSVEHLRKTSQSSMYLGRRGFSINSMCAPLAWLEI